MNSTHIPGGYLGLFAAFNVAVFAFVNPDKGKAQKWIFWGVVPIINIIAMTVYFGDLLAGLGLGGLAIFTMAVGYFRFRR